MMKSTTINNLNNLTTMLVANAVFCQKSDVESSKKSTLFEVLKYAIRKEAAMIKTFWESMLSTLLRLLVSSTM